MFYVSDGKIAHQYLLRCRNTDTVKYEGATNTSIQMISNN